MIPIFRKIRKKLADENRPLKYMRYAIGEIVLVVIGILIALQVNEWNEVRKQKAQVKSYTRAMISDLREDIKSMDEIRLQAGRSCISLDSLISYCRFTPIEDLSNLDLYVLSEYDNYKPYSWNRASFEEIKSSGILTYFNNDSLTKYLKKYEAYTKHMDLDYEQDINSAVDARKLLGRVVNRNYQLMDDDIDELATSVVHDSVWIIDFSSTKTYLQLKEQPINFINRDKALLEEAVNSYIQLSGNLRIRYENELPGLIRGAEAMIQLLEENYME